MLRSYDDWTPALRRYELRQLLVYAIHLAHVGAPQAKRRARLTTLRHHRRCDRLRLGHRAAGTRAATSTTSPSTGPALCRRYERERGRVVIFSFTNFGFSIFPFITSGAGIGNIITVMEKAAISDTAAPAKGRASYAVDDKAAAAAPEQQLKAKASDVSPEMVDTTTVEKGGRSKQSAQPPLLHCCTCIYDGRQ